MSDVALSPEDFNEDGILLPLPYRLNVYEKTVNTYIKPSTVTILVEYCCLRHDIKAIAERNNTTRERIRQILCKYQRRLGIKSPAYQSKTTLDYIKLLAEETQLKLQELQIEIAKLEQHLNEAGQAADNSN